MENNVIYMLVFTVVLSVILVIIVSYEPWLPTCEEANKHINWTYELSRNCTTAHPCPANCRM